MDPVIANGLIMYLMLVVLLTFHEYGHAWTAWKCGDDTARQQGRLSLNPLVHIDPIGTVLMPLLMIFLPYGVSRFLLGGAKPVPVNPANFRYPNRDDILVTLAGPGMNIILAVALLGVAKVLLLLNYETIAEPVGFMAWLSLMLCFFNLLLPIPPLDGSHIVRALIGMSHENYYRLAQYGYIPVILVLQIPYVRYFIRAVTDSSYGFLDFIIPGAHVFPNLSAY